MGIKSQKLLIILVVILLCVLLGQAWVIFKLRHKDKVLQRNWMSSPGGLAFRGFPFGFSLFSDRWENLDDFYSSAEDTFQRLRHIQRQLNKLFNEELAEDIFFPKKGFGKLPKENFYPKIDFQIYEDHYLIKIDLPGMEKDKIDVQVFNRMLSVSGRRETSLQEDKAGKFFRQERSFGYFSRLIPLPDDIQEDNISAEYKDGVLTVKIGRMKSDSQKNYSTKRINIL